MCGKIAPANDPVATDGYGWSNSSGVFLLDTSRDLIIGLEKGSYDTPELSPTKREVVFVNKVFGQSGIGTYEICVVNIETGESFCPVKDRPYNVYWPTWSPDGKKIAFTSSEHDEPPSLKIVDRDGQNETEIAQNAINPSWSPNGEWIAFNTSGSNDTLPRIQIISSDGKKRKDLGVTGAFATWSPTGEKIAFLKFNRDDLFSDNITLIDPNGENIRTIVNLKGEYIRMIQWENNEEIVFETLTDKTFPTAIGPKNAHTYVVKPNGTGLRRIS